MIRFLLDTAACVELIRGRSRRTLARLRRCAVGTVGVSSITLAELQYGAARSSRPEQNLAALVQFCAPLEVLDFDGPAAAAYGRVRTALERSGSPIGPLDTLIAAHAVSAGAALVSGNEREFKRVAGLKVENWWRG